MSDCIHAEHIHESMDALADVDKDKRQPTDTIKPQIFEFIKQRLNECDDIRKYVNKFIAHSASPESRDGINADELEITLGKIYDAHKVICEVASFIGQEILYRPLGGFLPTPQFDQLEHFGKPWVPEDNIDKLHEEWRSFEKETQGWEQWNWKTDYEDFRANNSTST